MERIIINKRHYVQAMHKHKEPGKNGWGLAPSFDNHGHPVFALPGGGRATEEELRGRGE
jgi:hypothetical protein